MEYGTTPYGVVSYGQTQLPTTERPAPDLLSYLPTYYRTSRVMTGIQGALGTELGKLWRALDEILAQVFVRTATWGLDRWEQELGIQTDPSRPIDYRRSMVLAKLRGVGTSTVALIQSVASSFSGGECDVIEYPAEYRFVVKFIGTRGIPPNLGDLTEAIEDVKPAHLAFSYAYTYMVWNETPTYTWDQVRAMTWDQLSVAHPRT